LIDPRDCLDVIRVHEFVETLGIDLPDVESFWKLGDATALRHRVDGSFFRSNYERGILLYALVSKYRPTSVLEFGTGRGYGCLCMAWAMRDCGIRGVINTIDMTSSDETIKWPICWNESDGPHVELMTRSKVWERAAERDWLEHIREWTGFSGAVMRRFSGAPVEFAFIDAGHVHHVVRHDFYTTLAVASEGIGILFDDYSSEDWGQGTRKLIQEEVLPHREASLILTDRRWPGGEKENDSDFSSGMVWMQCEAPQQLLDEMQPRLLRRLFTCGYWLWEFWYAFRLRAGRRVRQALRAKHVGARI
jgi:hypothetical protein